MEEFKKVWKPDLAHDGAGCISEHAKSCGMAKPVGEKTRGGGKAWASATKTRHQTGHLPRSAHDRRRAHKRPGSVSIGRTGERKKEDRKCGGRVEVVALLQSRRDEQWKEREERSGTIAKILQNLTGFFAIKFLHVGARVRANSFYMRTFRQSPTPPLPFSVKCVFYPIFDVLPMRPKPPDWD